MKKILTKLALKIADFFIWTKNHSPKFFKPLGRVFLLFGKFFILPIILFVYKNIVLLKIKTKGLNLKNTNYLIFVKKYLPGIMVAIIFFGATAQNILAKNYDNDEYANHTMLSALVRADESQWSEIIEDSGPALASPQSTSYLGDQGNLQELVYNSQDIDYDSVDYTGISADATSLVVGPEEGGPTHITRTENIQYLVESGDVLSTIADKFDVTVNTILWANSLTWTSTIKPGQKLIIPPGSGINHEVKRGDTVASIAKKYQADSDKILEANDLASATSIQIGDLIFVPNGVKPTQVVSSYKPPKKTETIPAAGDSGAYSDEVLPYAENIATGTKLLWPLLSHRITQYFSWRHTGLDVGDKVGNPIYAAEDGKVERSGWSSGYGYNVVINHGNGIQTIYGHASKLLVKSGETVSRGQTIALIGSTGWSTGPHLHFEVRVSGSRKNPLNYIK